MWEAPSARDLVAEKAQRAWVEWEGGREKLVVSVDPARVTPHLAWILPLPVRAAQARLALVDSLPHWDGEEVRAGAQLSLHPVLTALYFLFLVLAGAGAGDFAAGLAILFILSAIAIPSFGPSTPQVSDSVSVSAHTELGGLASELADAPSVEAFTAYLGAKGCVLPEAARDAVAALIKEGASFVVSWAKEPTTTKSLAVSVEFPSAKPWYPVRLTAGYGAEKTPIDLRLAGWLVPDTGREDLRVGYYQGAGEPRRHTRALYVGRASGLGADWTFKPRGWSPGLRLAAWAGERPILFNLLLLLACGMAGGLVAGWLAFPDWRGRRGLWPLAALGAAGLLPALGPGLALRRLRSEADGVGPPPLPDGMGEDEVRLLKRSGLLLMGTGAACEFILTQFILTQWLDSGISYTTGLVVSALGVCLFMRGKGNPWSASVALAVLTAPLVIVGPLACAFPQDPRAAAAAGRKNKAVREAWRIADPLPPGMDPGQVRRLKIWGACLLAAGLAGQVGLAPWLESGTPFLCGAALSALGTALYLRGRGRSWAGAAGFGLVSSPLVIIGPLLCAVPKTPEGPEFEPPYAPAERRWRRAALGAAGLALALDLAAVSCLGRSWSAPDSTASVGYSGSSLIRKSYEGATRGSLGALRSAVSAYYADTEGSYPAGFADLTKGGKYIANIPKAKTPPFHPDSNAVLLGDEPDDAGGWLYNASSGTVSVDCTHTDSKGSAWSSY